MNKNNTNNMSGMGALPLLIILGLIFGVGYFLLQGDLELPFDIGKTQKRLEVQRLDDFPLSVPVSGEREQIRRVIKSEEELLAFLSEVSTSPELTVSEKINFDKDYLLGVTSKALDNDGYELKVRRVYDNKEKGEIEVLSTLYKPGDSCFVTDGNHLYVDLVAISKTDKNISFDTQKEIRKCDD